MMGDHGADSTLRVRPRGVPLTFSVTNGRLGVWASRFEEIEPELLDLIDGSPPDTIFYDIGASIGLFALYAAKRLSCPVVAFEAEAQNFATMDVNHWLNRSDLRATFIALNVALSDVSGLGTIHTRTFGAGEHGKILDRPQTMDTKDDFEAEHVQSVMKNTLDEIIRLAKLPQPTLVKIDVDGAEGAVLRGAEATLTSGSVRTVFIELSDIDGSPHHDLLNNFGFRLDRRSPVVKLSGGFYPSLYNCIYQRN